MARRVSKQNLELRQVACPTCSAVVGEGCKTSGGARTDSHYARKRIVFDAQHPQGEIQKEKPLSEYVEVLHENITTEDKQIEVVAEKVALATLRGRVNALEEQVQKLTDTCARQAMIIVRTMATCEPMPEELEAIYKGLEDAIPTFDTVANHFIDCLKILKSMNAQDHADAQRLHALLKVINMQ